MPGPSSSNGVTIAVIGAAAVVIAAVIGILPHLRGNRGPAAPPPYTGAPSDSAITPSPQPSPTTGRAVTDVTGLQNTQAFNRLTDDGFDYRPEFEASGTVPMGHVIRTSPSAGTIVNKGTRVTVVISSGAFK